MNVGNSLAFPKGKEKAFFFEKKKQKTFVSLRKSWAESRYKNKKFFGSFFQKRTVCLLIGASP
jgi:hypothetical protein